MFTLAATSVFLRDCDALGQESAAILGAMKEGAVFGRSTEFRARDCHIAIVLGICNPLAIAM